MAFARQTTQNKIQFFNEIRYAIKIQSKIQFASNWALVSKWTVSTYQSEHLYSAENTNESNISTHKDWTFPKVYFSCHWPCRIRINPHGTNLSVINIKVAENLSIGVVDNLIEFSSFVEFLYPPTPRKKFSRAVRLLFRTMCWFHFDSTPPITWKVNTKNLRKR